MSTAVSISTRTGGKQVSMKLFAFFVIYLHAYVSVSFQFNRVIKRASTIAIKSVVETEKAELLNIFDSDSFVNDILACPESLTPLKKKTRIFGNIVDNYFVSSKYDTKYAILPEYYDLTIKAEVDRPFWDLSSSERVGQKFFQIPFISFIYERGYRQNFENFGFPGIEKEFEEANTLFTSLNANDTVMDLSCASGFMTRKYCKSGRSY